MSPSLRYAACILFLTLCFTFQAADEKKLSVPVQPFIPLISNTIRLQPVLVVQPTNNVVTISTDEVWVRMPFQEFQSLSQQPYHSMQPILPLPHAPAVPLITHQHLQQDEQAPVFSAPAAKKKKKSLRKIEEAVSSQQERFAYFMRYKYWRYPSLTQTDFELKRICDSWGLITAGEYRPTELETHRIVQEAQKKREYDQEEVRIHLELEKQGHQARERKEKERKEQYEREQEEALKLLELRKHAQEERKRKKKEVQLQRQREQEEARTLLEIEKQAQEQEARIQFNQACTNDLIQLLNNSTLDEKKILHFKRTYKSILEHSQDEKVKLIMQGIVKGKQYTYDAVPILRVIAKKEGVTVSSYLNKEAFHQWNVACVDRLMQDVYDFLFCGPHKRNAFEFQHDYTQKCAQVLEKATPLLRELNIVADSFLDFLSQLRAKLVNITNYSLLNGKQNPQALCTLHTVFKKAYRVLRPDEELSTLFENICKTIVEQGVEFCAQESGIESIIILGAPASGKERESYKNMLNAIVCTNQFDEVLCSYGKALLTPFNEKNFDEIKEQLEYVRTHESLLSKDSQGVYFLKIADCISAQIELCRENNPESVALFLRALSGSFSDKFRPLMYDKASMRLQTLCEDIWEKEPEDRSPLEKDLLYIAFRLDFLKGSSGPTALEELILDEHYPTLLYILNVHTGFSSKNYNGLYECLLRVKNESALKDSFLERRAVERVKAAIEDDNAGFSLCVAALAFAGGAYVNEFLPLFERKLFKLSNFDIKFVTSLDQKYCEIIENVLRTCKEYQHTAGVLRCFFQGIRIYGNTALEKSCPENSLLSLYEKFTVLEKEGLKKTPKGTAQKFTELCNYIRSYFAVFANGIAQLSKNDVHKNKHNLFAIKHGSNVAVHNYVAYNWQRHLLRKVFQDLPLTIKDRLVKSNRLADVFLVAALNISQQHADNKVVKALTDCVVRSPSHYIQDALSNQEICSVHWIRFGQMLQQYAESPKNLWAAVDLYYDTSLEKSNEIKIIGILSRLLVGIHPHTTVYFDSTHEVGYMKRYFPADKLVGAEDAKTPQEMHYEVMYRLTKDLVQLLKKDDYDAYEDVLEKIHTTLCYAEHAQKHESEKARSLVAEARMVLWNGKYSAFNKSIAGLFRCDEYAKLLKKLWASIESELTPCSKNSKKIKKTKKK